MSESKRQFWFVMALLVLLGYGYVRYASGWMSSSPAKLSLWTRTEQGIHRTYDQIVHEIKLQSDSGSEDSDSNLPDSDDAYFIAMAPITTFTASVMIKDFTPFYSLISEDWKARVGSAKVLRDVTFKDVMAAKPAFSVPTEIEITSEPKMLDEETLLIEGEATSGSEIFDFRLMAIQENGSWVANGLEVTLQK